MANITLHQLLEIKKFEESKSKKELTAYRQGILKGRIEMLNDLIYEFSKYD